MLRVRLADRAEPISRSDQRFVIRFVSGEEGMAYLGGHWTVGRDLRSQSQMESKVRSRRVKERKRGTVSELNPGPHGIPNVSVIRFSCWFFGFKNRQEFRGGEQKKNKMLVPADILRFQS